MDLALGDYLRFLFALLFVLGLIGGLALVGKRFGVGNRGPTTRGTGRRLAIVETLALDAKRRLVLVRRDGTEHLVLIGATGEQVIETGIAPRSAPSAEAEKSTALILSLSEPALGPASGRTRGDGPAAPPHASTGSA